MKKVLLILIYTPFIGFGKNSISMKKILLILLLLPIIGHTQGVKNIHSISDARMPLIDHGYTLDGQMMNMSSANKVLSADNFGPTGTYPQSFSIISGYSTSNSLAAITSNSNIDLFFFGGFDKNNPSLIPFTNAELDSLHKWSMNGGKMIIGASANSSAQNNSILNAKWDFDLIEDPNAVIVPSSAGLSSSIFDGPFGYNLNSLQNMWVNQGGSIRGYFNIIPSNSIVLAEDWIGNPTLILDCKTLDLIVADCDAYTILGDISNGPLISTRNDTFWANTIVYMDMIQSQPVISLSGNMLSTTALYSSYQWFKDSIAILGANSSSHNTLGQVGSYHVGANLDCGCNNVASNSIIIGAVDGCTDPAACNYDSGANTDDGSCEYLNASVSISNVSCNGFTDGSVVATANGGASPNYQYSLGGGLSQANGTFSNLIVGTYSIDVTDINGCSSNQIFTITEPNPLFVNAFSTDVSCFGYCDGSAFSMPSGGTSPYSYLWSNTNITDNISALCAGAYVVNITDANNCVNIDTVVISEPPPLVLNNTINGCDSVLLGSNYYTISGAYTDTLTSANGCDSVVNTNLTIEQNTSSYDTLSVGASIVWNGIPLNLSGDYSVTLINSVECDSIVNLNLTVTTTGISDIDNNKSNLVKITDMLGQETPYRKNTPLFYIYDDGTVEKKLIFE